MCKYCELKKGKGKWSTGEEIRKDGISSVYIAQDDERACITIDLDSFNEYGEQEDFEWDIDIKYCPFCGREL